MATITPPRSPASGNGFKPQHRAAPARPSFEGEPLEARPERLVGPAGRVLAIMLVCFVVWGVLAAPALRRAAETSPLGIRRTASLAVLRPLSRISALLGLDRLGSAADRALGRKDVAPAIPPAAVTLPRPLRPEGSTPASALGPILPKPTAAHPLSVLMVGDSIGADLAFGLSRLLAGKETFRTHEDTRQSSGLARPDYFNWPNEIAADLVQRKPDVVVAMFGGNDNQNLLIGDHGIVLGSAEWKAAYGARVARVMDLVTGSGRPLVWVGMPIMKDPGRSKIMRMLNSIYRSEARAHPGVVYVDAYDLFANARGHYSAFLRDPAGHLQQVRESDGVHLTIGPGGTRLAQAAYRAMQMFWTTPMPPLPTSSPPPQTVPLGGVAG
ncbi:MAG TPA: DUF459 domain-containing protein [Actinomycetota bacterium]